MVATATAVVTAATGVTAVAAATGVTVVATAAVTAAMAVEIRSHNRAFTPAKWLSQPQRFNLWPQIEVNNEIQFRPVKGSVVADHVGMAIRAYRFRPKCAEDRAGSA
jgi:hypothetical protein